MTFVAFPFLFYAFSLWTCSFYLFSFGTNIEKRQKVSDSSFGKQKGIYRLAYRGWLDSQSSDKLTVS